VAPSYPLTRVIYNGPSGAIETIPQQNRHNGTLIFAGRIDPGKGVEDAIEVACVLGKKLHLYGAPQAINTTYFETRIQPLLKRHPHVTYHGLVDQQTLFHQLSHAQALLLPLKLEEPLSTIVIEAISLGTPAVMYDPGSAHELLVEGISGYVVPADDLAALAEAVQRTESLDRSRCAAYAREYFSLEKCVKEYIKLYTTIVQSSNWS
jgi:glycosyltransferase involved in cell wall biosynthesis